MRNIFPLSPGKKNIYFCRLPPSQLHPPPARWLCKHTLQAVISQAARQRAGQLSLRTLFRFVSGTKFICQIWNYLVLLTCRNTQICTVYIYKSYAYVCVVCVFPFLIFKLLLRFDFEQRLNVCNTFTSIDSQLEPSRTGRANESLWPNKCPIRFAVCVQWINGKNLA